MVIPEIGFDDDPTSPVSRDETVTKRKPKIMISSAPARFIWSDRKVSIRTTSPMIPPITHRVGISCSVLAMVAPATVESPRRSLIPARMLARMVGIDRNILIMPAVATAPAPM